MNTVTDQRHAFITHLENLVREKDRGALAGLRRGLGRPPGTAREMDRHILTYLPAGAGIQTENAYYLIGALFAYWHQGKENPSPGAPVNLGASLRALIDHEAVNGNREEAEKRIEKRFIALLNSHREDLPDHLRHIVGLLKSNDIPVNWTQLLWDVRDWQREERDVRRRWSREFWRNSRASEKPETDTDPTMENENTEEE